MFKTTLVLLSLISIGGNVVNSMPERSLTPPPLEAMLSQPCLTNTALPLRTTHATETDAVPASVCNDSLGDSKAWKPAGLLVVGAGFMGHELIEQFKATKKDSHVVALTRTNWRHSKLLAVGAEPYTVGEYFPEEIPHEVDNVVFLVPPVWFGYLETLQSALKKWGGRGKFVYASSTSVFSREGEVWNEQSPTDPAASPNAEVLLEAEKLVLAAGGTVLRFAGLYSLEPGVGSFFLRGGQLATRADRRINLVSYHDAASAVLKVLDAESKTEGEVFVISDGQTQTMKDVFQSALQAGKYKPLEVQEMPEFTGEGEIGATLDTHKAKSTLGWLPSTPSFDAYCTAMALKGAQEDMEGLVDKPAKELRGASGEAVPVL